MPDNAEIEMHWVDAWNDLLDLVGNATDVMCHLPNGRTVDVEECKAWLQDSVYQGFLVRVEAGRVEGRWGLLTFRWKDEGGASG